MWTSNLTRCAFHVISKVVKHAHILIGNSQPNATVHVNDTTHRGPEDEGFHYTLKFPGYDMYWGFVQAYADAMAKYCDYEMDVCGSVAEFISNELNPPGPAAGNV